MMDARQYNLAHAVFIAACDRTEEERARYIDEACGDDAQVRAAVLRMLERDGQELVVGDPACRPLRLGDLLADRLRAEHDAEAAETIPARIGEYRVIRKVGQGGMGAVFEAEQDQPRRRVAVKMLRQGPGTSTLLKRFRREIELLGMLQHPGIAQIYSAGSMSTPSGTSPYFAMEFVDGLAVNRFAEEHSLSVADRVRLVAQACDAVQFAHQQGIVHRDLKPQNMLVARGAPPSGGEADSSAEGIALKILDFGIARVLDDANRGGSIQTEMGQVIGTICYMSPEQLSGDNAAVDIRADVYALGVVLYELLTGRLPHDLSDKTIPQAVKIVAFDPPTRLSRHRRELRGDLEAIVAKAIEKDKAGRYASASELGADLRRYLRSEPVTARPLTALYQLSRFARRNRKLVWSIGTALAFLVLGSVGTSIGLYHSVRSEQRALASEATARRESYRLALAAADASWLTDPAQARALLESAPPELRGWEWKHFSSRMDAVIASFQSEGTPAVAVDARAGPVAAVVRAGAVEIVDMQTGGARATCRSDAALSRPRFSRDGTRVLAASEADGKAYIAAFDTSSGARVGVFETVEPGVGALSDDGRVIALVSPRRTIELRETDTGVLLTEVSDDPQDPPMDVRFLSGGILRSVPLRGNQRPAYSASTGERIARPSVVERAEPLYDVRGDLVLGHQPDTPYFDVRAVEVWRASEPGAIRFFKGHAGRLQDAAISPDGALIASSGFDSTVRIWDVAGGACLRVIGLPQIARSLRWAADGKALACVDNADRALLLAIDRAESLVLRGHASFVFHAVFSPDGRLIASAGWNNEVRLWDARTGAPLCQVNRPDGSFRAPSVLGFSRDGATLVADDSAWDVSALLRNPMSPASARGEAPPGERWPRLASNARVATHTGGQFGAISGEGTVVAQRIGEGVLRITDIDGKEIQRIPAKFGSRPAVAVAPGGRLAATSSNDRIIRIWDLTTGKQVRELSPRPLDIYSIDFSPDGTRLAAAGEEGAIIIWDARSWDLLAELRGHTEYVSAVSFSLDGTRLVSASGDGTVRVWDSEPQAARRAQALTDGRPPPAESK